VTERGEYWAEVGGTMAGVDKRRDAGCAPGQVSRRRQWQPRVWEGNTNAAWRRAAARDALKIGMRRRSSCGWRVGSVGGLVWASKR
jgi:hypothetical protein